MRLFIRSKNQGTNTSRNQTVKSTHSTAVTLKAEQSTVSPWVAWVDGLFVSQKVLSVPVSYRGVNHV